MIAALKSSVAIAAGLALCAFMPNAALADAWAETFVGCELQTVTGAGLSIESYACGPDKGSVHLEADDTVPGFVEVSEGEDGPVRTVKIRTFKKGADAPIDAILEQIRTDSPGPDTATCALSPMPGDDQHFVFEPTGEAKTAWQKADESGEAVDPPCGPLGVQFVGDIYFQTLPDDPTTVVMVDTGSEIQIFKPATLKAVK